ncbi:S-adenosyl-L-methionine-dependent methyltransferase [Venturia nashicola]|nr:S-adenosyl-L-methionine-dependent methyltransferase [Venturia nashicola]
MLDERNSFSTTDSTPSLPYHIHDHPKAKPPIRHVPSVDAYNMWAEVYDTDGNMLQSIDDHELETLLPEFLQLVVTSTNEDKGKPNTPLIDFGCGTGRTTQTLIHAPWPPNSKVQIQGIDASGILSLAGQNPKNIGSALPRKEETVEFHFDNFLNTRNPRSAIMLEKGERERSER